MTDREIIQQALEALLHMCNTTKAQNDYNAKIVDKALVALETALAQPEQATIESIYETIVKWDEGGGKRSRRELARRIVALTNCEHITDGTQCWCEPTKESKHD